MSKAVFYHAGCAVCTAAEQQFVSALNPDLYQVEVVHLGQDKSRIGEAEAAGVQSVPALVLDGKPYHINFGASLDAVKGL
jgi:glutaredoxin